MFVCLARISPELGTGLDLSHFKEYVNHQVRLGSSETARHLERLYGGEFRGQVFIHSAEIEKTPEKLRYVGKLLSDKINGDKFDVRYFFEDGTSFVLGRDPFPGNPEIDENAEKRVFDTLDKIERYGNEKMYSRFMESIHLAHEDRKELERLHEIARIQQELKPEDMRLFDWKTHGGIIYSNQEPTSLKKKVAASIMTVSLLGAASIPLAKAIPGYEGKPIKVPYTKDPPVVDGACKIDEWKGAEVTKLAPYSFTNDQAFLKSAEGYLMTKHNDTGLYVCVDFVSQKTLKKEMTLEMDFDTGHNGFINGQPQKDDTDVYGEIISFQGDKVTKILKWGYTNPPSIDKVLFAASLSPSPNVLTSKNLQWEFFIPSEIYRLYPDPTNPNIIGFYLRANATNYRNGVAYPRVMDNVKDYYGPLADMIFLPQTTTTTSISSTTTSKSTISTSSTSTTTSSSKTTNTPSSEPTDLSGLEWVLFPLIIVSVGAGVYILRKIKV
jgi:hypothetical protein